MLSLPEPALQTFVALLLAHVLADFVFQSKWMVENKRKPKILLLHIAIVFVISAAMLGGNWILALLIAAAHLTIDAAKTWLLSQKTDHGVTLFFIDQIAHIATIAAAAIWMPQAAASGIWGPWLHIAIIPAIVLSGFIITVNAGGHVVGLVTSQYAEKFERQGLPQAGKTIGQLERTLIFLLIMIQQPAGIGFLIAAKSLLRFEATKEQEASEYVIIGTLTSFGWGLAMSSGTFALAQIAAELSALTQP